jgi:hypothetical protein
MLHRYDEERKNELTLPLKAKKTIVKTIKYILE